LKWFTSAHVENLLIRKQNWGLLITYTHTTQAERKEASAEAPGARRPEVASRKTNPAAAVVGCKIPRKENPPIFRFFSRPPVPVSPGLPEDDPTIDKNKRPGYKNWVD